MNTNQSTTMELIKQKNSKNEVSYLQQLAHNLGMETPTDVRYYNYLSAFNYFISQNN